MIPFKIIFRTFTVMLALVMMQGPLQALGKGAPEEELHDKKSSLNYPPKKPVELQEKSPRSSVGGQKSQKEAVESEQEQAGWNWKWKVAAGVVVAVCTGVALYYGVQCYKNMAGSETVTPLISGIPVSKGDESIFQHNTGLPAAEKTRAINALDSLEPLKELSSVKTIQKIRGTAEDALRVFVKESRTYSLLFYKFRNNEEENIESLEKTKLFSIPEEYPLYQEIHTIMKDILGEEADPISITLNDKIFEFPGDVKYRSFSLPTYPSAL